MSTPLPCPFCGHVGVDIVEGSTHRWRVAECPECGARSGEVRWNYMDPEPDSTAKARAITEWNTRA